VGKLKCRELLGLPAGFLATGLAMTGFAATAHGAPLVGR
jgi:hypothetical protein